MPKEKILFVDSSRAVPTIFSMKKIYSLKLLSGFFMGNHPFRLSKVLSMVYFAAHTNALIAKDCRQFQSLYKVLVNIDSLM